MVSMEPLALGNKKLGCRCRFHNSRKPVNVKSGSGALGESGTPTIKFDGEKLVLKEYGTLTRPITQVNAASNWLKNLLLETTGKKYSIKPVILFPGWYVESTDKGRKSSVWVLNPKAFPHFLENQPDLLSKEDIMLASYHISRYIRTYKTA